MSLKLGNIDLNSDLVSVETNSNLNGTTLVESTMGNSAGVDALMDQSADQIRAGGHGGSLIDSGVEEIRVSEQMKDVGTMINNGGTELVEMETRGDKDKLEDAFVHTEEGENNMFSLVVDLNMHHVADGKIKSNGNVVKNAVIHLNGIKDGNQDEAFIEQGTCINVDNNGCNNNAPVKEDLRIEKEGEFEVSDLVWGKVPSHPWWPGQIYDRSVASKKALRYKKNEGFLIAYFGDQTFAWNDASTIKPFRMYFSQMHKQSNMDSFTNALNCALEEISRRVEYGLSCRCLPKQVYFKIETQVNVNGGIRKESRARVGGDNFSTVASFGSSKLVDYVKDLAQAPFDIIDRLEFVTTRAQLLAFNRWKGYAQIPKFTILNGLMDDDKDRDPEELTTDYRAISSKCNDQVSYGKGKSIILDNYDQVSYGKGKSIILDNYDQVSYGKGKSIILDNSSRKHKLITAEDCDCVRRRKREKCMSHLMSKNCPDREDHDNMEEKGESGGQIPVSPGTASNTLLSEKLFKVGDRIRKVANQLSGSTSILKHADRKTCNTEDVDKKGAKVSNGVLYPRECPPALEMLSQLSFIAVDPMKGCNNLIATISFFSDFRNLVCLENFEQGKINHSKMCVAKVSDDADGNKSFGPEGESEKEMTSVETEAPLPANARSDSAMALSCENLELEADKTVGHTNEELENNPTVLVLNFNDFKSIPSEAKLNNIFSPFGPLIESYTEVLKKNNRAKVVFKRRVDAEKAFSSAGKFSTFGPSLISYRLNYKISPRKPSTSVTKRKRKDATPVKVKEL